MEKLQNLIEQVEKNPLWILEKNNENDQKETIKQIHDNLIQNSVNLQKQKNEKLITKGTDLDQIWEQLKIHFDILTKQSSKKISKIYEKVEQKKIQDEQENSEQEESSQETQESSENLQDIENMTDQENLQEQEGEDFEMDSENLDDFQEEQEELEESYQDEQDEQEEQEEQEEHIDEEGKDEENDELQKFLEQADYEDMNFEETKRKFEKGELNQDLDDSEDLGSEYEFGSVGEFNDEEKAFFDTTDGNYPKSSKVSKNEAEDFFGKLKKGSKKQMEFDEDEDEEGEENEEGEELDDNEVENDIFDEQRENALMDQQDENEKIHNEDEIQRLENQLIGESAWQTKGEVKSQLRPVNSLVNETLDFKNNKKQVENITQEYSEKLEDMIKQRILDEAFDDRQRVVNTAFIKENFTEFSKEKNEKGLADLYEDEFKSQLNLNTVSKDDKLKKEILELFKETCYKLDCLTNLSFTPKPFVKEAEIQASNLKLNIDEKIPLGHLHGDKNSQLNARELVDKKKDAKFLSKEEMSHEEKQTERARNKKAGRVRQKEKDRKKMLKHLEFTGQTKHEYNLLQQAKQEGKKIAKNKQQSSVKFNKSGQFFTNLQETLKNPDNNNKKAIMDAKSKKIKKNEQKL
ncbi:hypothetical protein PPERSA_04665 [Pseudocohnilembus persalinus]|uniref:Uncharacterized protein n=1 Tax=Pseudocohnilembus persalinus TaxID=266149 RepID=A0A0V0R4F2_PSEPJ|nr:hypothetical protein PPERSA_04665 [Pseudocohnilembus persalinus]|eukprot:KRX09359.1 hypothetical protein PPERSA_04665 [Pseudocohnilembus persalinus]